MGKNIIISYLEDEYWTAKTPQEIRIVPLAHRKTVHGISIFFSAEDYLRTWKDYEEIKTIVFTVSKGAAWVNTLFSDYNHGYLSIIINIAHKQYTDEAVIRFIQKIVKFLKERKETPSART